MNTRTIQSNVMFLYPFRLQGVAGLHPAGLYRLVTDQELIHGVSFTTYRTIMAFLEVPAQGTGALATRQLPIDLSDLDTCVRADRLAASNPALQTLALPAPAMRESA